MDRNFVIDVLRIVACIGVLILHVMGFDGSLINTLFYYSGTISIPLFFMISGFLVLHKKDLNVRYILKRIINMAVVILILSLAYASALAVKGNHHFIDNITLLFIGSIFQKSQLSLLWFLWTLMILYLLAIPLKKLLYSRYRKKAGILFLLLSETVFLLQIYLSCHYGPFIYKEIPQTFRLWTWITYFYLGGCLKTDRSENKNVQFIALIACTAICITYEYILAKNIFPIMFAESFYDSLLIKIWVFVIIRFVCTIPLKNKELVLTLANATTGVYLIQVFLFKILNRLHFDNFIYNLLLLIILIIVCFAASVLINKKTTIIKKIINMRIL